MDNQRNDFVTPEVVQYQFKIGKYIASSLSGFIAGVIVSSIVWIAVAHIINIER